MKEESSGTGIFRKVLNLSGTQKDKWYITEELSFEEKKDIDEFNAKMMNTEWKVEESCIQELYSTLYFNTSFEFYHKGHLYSFDSEIGNKTELWQIYDRDLNNPTYAYNCYWDNEPHFDYPDLPSLIFDFKLRNDGRTIAEYCCDYWKQPHILVPEPVDKNLVRKIWRH